MVRMSAAGQDYSRSLALGTQAALTVGMWLYISVDRNTYSTPFSIDNGTSDNWLMQTAADGTTLTVYNDAAELQNMGSLTVGTWYFVGLAMSGGTGTLYHRIPTANVLSTVAISGGSASVNAATLRLGESPWGGEWWNGRINAVKIWTAQLSAAEMLRESMQYVPHRTANLAAFYPLVVPETTDYSGNGRTLTGSGATREDGPPIPWQPGRPRLVRTAAAGGTTFPVSLAGSATPTGGLARQAGHRASGAVTPTGVAAKQDRKQISAATAPNGGMVRVLARALTGTVTPSGALASIRSRLLAVAGVITPSGTATKRTSTQPAGATTPVGAIGRQTAKTFSDATTPAGVVASIRTRLLAVAGAMTPGGQLARRIGKQAAGSVDPAGSLTKVVARALAAAVAPIGALAATRTRLLAVAGAIAPVGAVVKRTARVFGGGVSPAAALLKLLGRALSGGITPTGLVTNVGGDLTPTVTPPERTLAVSAETRTLFVPADARTRTVAPESRTLEA